MAASIMSNDASSVSEDESDFYSETETETEWETDFSSSESENDIDESSFNAGNFSVKE